MSAAHQLSTFFRGFFRKERPAERWLPALVAACVGFGIAARCWRLGYPSEIVFDEVYFAKMAAGFFKQDLIFDAHPALGKYLIAIGIWLFGDTPFGWRIVPLVAGIALIGLVALLSRAVASADGDESPATALVPDWVAPALLAALVAIDGMFIVYSRYSLMEGILLLALGGTLLAAYRLPKRWVWLLGLLVGLCVGIKWLAIAIVVPVALIAWQRKLLGWFAASLLLAVPTYLTIIFTAGWIGGWGDPVAYTYWWHQNVWAFETNLHATHPWGSEWWSWPLLQKPLLFYRNYVQPGAAGPVAVIVALPNPLLWWLGGVAALCSLWELLRQLAARGIVAVLRHPLAPLLAGWGAFFLPWMLVHRVLFIYHYFPSYLFALLMLGYWLRRLWPAYSAHIMAALGLLAVVSLYFLPVWVGLPIARAAVGAREWLPSWVF